MKNDVSNRYLVIFAQYHADIDVAESTSDLRRVTDGGCTDTLLARLPCGNCSEFIQQRIQEAFMALFTAFTKQ